MNDRYSEWGFRKNFFKKNNVIVFGELINQLMFRNYATNLIYVASSCDC